MINKLPNWAFPHTKPAFQDVESATALEATAKLYGAVNEVIEEINKFEADINNKMEEFTNSTNADVEVFKTAMRQEFQDFINVIDLKLSAMSLVLRYDEETESVNLITGE